MAICDYCEQEMTAKVGCKPKTYDDFADGIERERVPFTISDFCHDCSTPRGKLHHPGCDDEKCPKCGGQAIGCDCELTEEEKQ